MRDGHPSITQPTAAPWLSPNVATLKIFQKIFPIMRVNIATPKKISTIYRNSFRPPNIALYPIKGIFFIHPKRAEEA